MGEDLGGVAAFCTASRVACDGTLSVNRSWAIVEAASLERTGSSAVSGLLTLTPWTALVVLMIWATSAEFDVSVIFPEVAVSSTWPLAPVSPNRALSTSWPCCDSVPGMATESSYLSPSMVAPPAASTSSRNQTASTTSLRRASAPPRRNSIMDTSGPRDRAVACCDTHAVRTYGGPDGGAARRATGLARQRSPEQRVQCLHEHPPCASGWQVALHAQRLEGLELAEHVHGGQEVGGVAGGEGIELCREV